jgi:tetratricopeptide (TPR) repeat protein
MIPVSTMIAWTSLQFTPDGQRLLGGVADGRAYVWSVAPPGPRAEARARAARARAEVWPFVAEAYEELVSPELVAKRLEKDPALDADHRACALRIAGAVGGSVEQIEDEVWPVVRARNAPVQDTQAALWKARLACALEPDEEGQLRLLGMALYRLDRYAEALAALERSDELRTERRRARPETAAFLAMTHHRLGNAEEAQRYLETVRGLMQIAVLQASKDSIAFLREAEALCARDQLR